MTLMTRDAGGFQVELSGATALQALQLISQGDRVAITGRLVRPPGGAGLRIRASVLYAAVDATAAADAAGAAPRASRATRAPGELAPYKAALRERYEAGWTLQQIASERGGRASPGSIVVSLLEMFDSGALSSPHLLAAQLFASEDGAPSRSGGRLCCGEVSEFVGQHLAAAAAAGRVDVTLSGSPRLSPIRDALLVSGPSHAGLAERAAAQEVDAAAGGGVWLTFSQLRYVLATAQRHV
uniref:Uncharacterized protein n=1 Tax=Chlamydomonas euryale TaxID=1486919 RepID=A0A7R9Z7H1_9CHLO|mmetsp:Transcript_7112/g.21706  ORF Transcript_7112/g.21706 Transcript_7112/m.21706 type:complete len:240 (+) Transcript_7112:297-1016(+)